MQDKTYKYHDLYKPQLSGNAEHVVIYANHGIPQFYLVGIYILSGNAEHVVVYINHDIYLFYLACVYILSGNPEHVVVYTNHGIDQFYLVGVYIHVLLGNPEGIP
jgi:hypothetical protein